MSVVAVKIHKDKIEFAADSIGIKGTTKRNNIAKLAKVNGMVIGGVGTMQELSLLLIFAKTHRPNAACEKDVVDFFFEFEKWKGDLYQPFISENIYVVGINGKAFYIEGLLVHEIKDYEAIGAGMDYALAALYLSHNATEAVNVACELSCYVSKPIITINIPKEETSEEVLTDNEI